MVCAGVGADVKPYYDHGGIVLYHGDAREILPHLLVKADLVVTDPPYAVSFEGVTNHGPNGTRSLDFFECDRDWPAATELARSVVALARGKLAPHGSLYAWCGHRQIGTLVADAEAAGFSTRFLVWSKPNPPPPMPGSGWPSAAELCLYAYRPGRVWTHDAINAPPP